jgi:hypothetical protein
MRIRYQVGLGLLVLTLLYALFRRLVAMLLSGKGTTICPHCGSRYIHVSNTQAYIDSLFRIFGCLAYRCRVCNLRFYRPKFST